MAKKPTEERPNALLPVALSAAVPLWQADLAQVPWAELVRDKDKLAQLIAEKGDILMFGGSKKKGEVAEVFNAAARGIAILSFIPGGVTIFGEHWEASHPDITYPEGG